MAEQGKIWSEMQLPPISRAQLALFAGGSGDHNPIHIDTDAAHAAGFDDVFAQGMLSMALVARLLTRNVPQERIRQLSARFEAICKVGETLSIRAAEVERFVVGGEPRLRLALSAIGADDRRILSGEAVIATEETQ